MAGINDEKRNPDHEIIPEIADIRMDQLNEKQIGHVLLLTMSTLNNVSESRYFYLDQDGIKHVIYGFGQLEPVPKMFIEQKKTPLLILIIATRDAREKRNFEITGVAASREASKNETIHDQEIGKIAIGSKWYGSAVEFFKMQIMSYVKSKTEEFEIGFKVIEIEEEENMEPEYSITKASSEVVNLIRQVHGCNSKLRLYLDMHGGRRDDQLIVDAIVNMLHMESIMIEKTYSVPWKWKNVETEIKDAAGSMRIFDFVSGMNEFINYGYGQSLENYVKSYLEMAGNSSTWCGNLAKNISEVTNALTLCQVTAFEEALDNLKRTIDNNTHEYPLFDIFISNIERDYGDLLNNEKRTLYAEVAWALKKGFYQQCMAIIEAKTAEFVFDELVQFDPFGRNPNTAEDIDDAHANIYWNSVEIKYLEKLKEKEILCDDEKHYKLLVNQAGEAQTEGGEKLPGELSGKDRGEQYARILKNLKNGRNSYEKLDENPRDRKNFFLRMMFRDDPRLTDVDEFIKTGDKIKQNKINIENREMVFVYYGKHESSKSKDGNGKTLNFQYRFYLAFQKKDGVDFEEATFRKFGETWWYLKDKVRNKVFHVDEGHHKDNAVENEENILTVPNVKEKITEYLELLKELMPDEATPCRESAGHCSCYEFVYDATVVCRKTIKGKTKLWVKIVGEFPVEFENYTEEGKPLWEKESDGRIIRYTGKKDKGDKIKVKIVKKDAHKAVFEESTE